MEGKQKKKIPEGFRAFCFENFPKGSCMKFFDIYLVIYQIKEKYNFVTSTVVIVVSPFFLLDLFRLNKKKFNDSLAFKIQSFIMMLHKSN